MARFFSREEWPLIVAGIVAGVITSAAVLLFFFKGLGGGGQDDTLLNDATAGRAERAPVIGAREAAIKRQLDATRPSATPLSGPLSVTLRTIVWNEQGGAQFARAEAATATLSLNSVRKGDVLLDDVVIRRPVVALREARGAWNFERVFAKLLEGEDNGRSSAPRRIEVADVRIENGQVDVTRPNQTFAFHDVNGTLNDLIFAGPGVAAPSLRAETMTAQLVRPDAEALDIDLEDGLFAFPDGRVRFDVAAVSLDRTELADIEGTWNPEDPGFGITARGRAVAVNFADIRSFAPERIPEEGNASFRWEVRPLPPNRTAVVLSDLDARSGNSRVTGALTVNLAPQSFELRTADLLLDPLQLSLVEDMLGRELPYAGTVAGRVRGTDGLIGFDVVTNLTSADVPDPFRAELTGSVRMLAGGGFALQQVDANLTRVPLAALKAFAPGLPLNGFVTGRVSLTGAPDRSPIGLNVRLELGSGVALVEGSLDLTGDIPTYDLSGRLVGVDIDAILEPDVPPVQLTARFAVSGAGTDPATMNANFRVDGRFSGWRADEDDAVLLVAAIRAGTLDVDTLNARLATASVAANGEWRFNEPQQGAVTYALDIADMAPFGPYLPMLGDSVAAGSLRGNGRIAGTLARMTLAGEATGTELRFGGWQAGALTATYELTTGSGALPVANIVARATGIVTPTAGNFSEGNINLQMTPPALAFEAKATREQGGVFQVVATGNVPETGTKTINVQQASLDLESGTWALMQPATIELLPDGTTAVRGLVFAAAGSEGRMQLDGVVRPFGSVDIQLAVAALPVADVQALLGQPPRVEGTLWANGNVRGGTENPLVDLTFRLQDGAVQGVPLTRAEGQITYRDNVTALDAVVVVDTVGHLDVDVQLPSRLSFGDSAGFELIDGVPLRGTVVAQEFSLASVAAAIPRIRDVTGRVNARVDLSGTPEAPVVAGTLTLAGGGLTVPELNQTYTEITGNLSFDGQRLVVNDLRARSDGWATVTGEILLERLDEPVMNINVGFDGFRPMGVEDQGDAAVFGTVSVTGPFDQMLMTGALRAEDGYFVLPEFGPRGVSTALVDITQPASVVGRNIEAPNTTGWMRNLEVRDLRVAFGEGVWLQTAEARIQLEGELRVSKIGDATPITGTLTGTRGQYTMIAGPIIRRFQIVSAEVRFLGQPTPDPAINIVARRTVVDPSARQLDVDVRIGGTLSRPTLSIAGGEGAPVAESELLSFLLFGQSTASFAGDVLPGDQVLEQTFFGGLAEIGALELERSLGGLGLDIFEVRFGQGGLGGITSPTFVFGRQLSDKLFITVETGVAALVGESSDSPLEGWAVRLDWTIDRRSRVRLAWEPVYRGRMLRSSGLALPLNDPKQQLLMEYRRRWNY